MDEGGRRLEVVDYVVFSLMLTLSTAIGLFYVIKDRKKQNTEVYLMGGRSMSAYPVALSLTVGFISAVLVLGLTSDIYRYGGGYLWSIPALMICGVITSEIYITTFFKANITTAYDYLEKRFNRAVRIEGTLIYMTLSVLYIGIAIYAPSLALNAVTGLDLWGIVVSTGVICVIYSTLGGLKAVIWTDALQFVVMLMGMLSILIKSSEVIGGFDEIWKRCVEGGRINFLDFNAGPQQIYSVWSCGFSGVVVFLATHAVNQGQVMRYISCGTVPEAKKAIWIFMLGSALFQFLAVLCGFAMYAYYSGCDPITNGVINQPDQLLPYMVLDIFQHNPGMPGVFIACVYSGALSTVSTSITAMASVVVEDFLKPNFVWKEKTFTIFSRILVAGFGLLCILFAFLTSKIGGIFEAAVAVFGIVGGPLLGVYTLGMLVPISNYIGALVGLNFGLVGNIWIFFGKRSYPPNPEFQGLLPFSTSNCSLKASINISSSTNTSSPLQSFYSEDSSITVDLYRMSPWFYSSFGFFVTVSLGIIASCLYSSCRKKSEELDPDLIYPFFDHWIFTYLPEQFKEMMRCGVKHPPTKRKEEEKIELNQNENDEDVETALPTNQMLPSHCIDKSASFC